MYVECQGGAAITKEDAAALDRRLCLGNDIYALFREKSMLKAVDVISVQRGTFAKVRDAMVEQLGCNPTQTKIPRVIRAPELVNVLETYRAS